MTEREQKEKAFKEKLHKSTDEEIKRRIKNRELLGKKKTEAELVLEKRKNEQESKLNEEHLALAKSSNRRSWWAIIIACCSLIIMAVKDFYLKQ